VAQRVDGVFVCMVTASRVVNTACVAALLFRSPVLLRGARRRDKRCLRDQLRFAALFWLLKRLSVRARESERIENLIQYFPSLQRLELFLESPVGAAVLGSAVPAALALAGVTNLLGVAHKWRRRFFRKVLIFGSVPMLVDAVEERFGENVDVIAVCAFELGLLMGQHGAAAVTLLMLTGGEALEHYAFARARENLGHVLDDEAPVAHRLRSRSILETSGVVDSAHIVLDDIAVEDVETGDILSVRVGEAVPVDGCLHAQGAADGVVTVEESLITGEAGDTVKNVNDRIHSGSIAKAPLWLRVEAPYAGSTLELMRRALQDALDRKGSLQSVSATASSCLQPLTLVAAVLVLGLRRGAVPLSRWTTVLSVFMAATPCPASIGVPVAFISCMSVAAKHSVLIKSGAAIEAVASARHIVLDKTGTLTQGRPRVHRFTSFDFDSNKALQLVASTEASSTHPLATAVIHHAESKGLGRLQVAFPESISGLGVAGVVSGHHILVGTRRFLSDRDIVVSTTESVETHMETFFAIDGKLAGSILFDDDMRPGTAEAITLLRKLGLQVAVLSGDRSAHLAATAKQLAIDDARGGCLPHEKAKCIQELLSGGGVIMVGDEGNDAAALAAASVGIVVGTRSGLASKSADIVVSDTECASPLERVARLVALCRNAVGTARRGAEWGLGASAVQVVAASLGLIPPRTNAVMQEMVDVSALLNAVSVLRYRW